MRIRRAFVWVYPVLLLAMGIGFQIWSISQGAAADTYRNAPVCSTATTSACYELVPGQIRSVQVRQTSDGERDDVVIQTTSGSSLSATLEPAAAAAPHVRSGAEVTVKVYESQVTLVDVDGFAIASTANPVATQGDASSAGWLLIALGLVSFALPLYPLWRRRKGVDSQVAGSDPLPGGQPLQVILPSGNLGWAVRPRRSVSSLWRYGFAAVVLLGMTYPAIVDPVRTEWAVLFDSVVILGMLGAVGLFLRNDLVFADSEAIGKTDLFGRTISLPRHEVLRADRFSVATRSSRNQHLVFVRADGLKAFEVVGPAWDYGRLDDLCEAAGIKLSGSYDELVGAFRLNQRVPGTTRWGQQLLMGLGLVVFIVAFVALLIGPGKR